MSADSLTRHLVMGFYKDKLCLLYSFTYPLYILHIIHTWLQFVYKIHTCYAYCNQDIR